MEEKYKIHAFYVLLILGLIIIGLVTVKWAAITGLKDYITFALTVTSLTLAILAIIYTIYANTSLSQNIYSIESSSKNLSLISTELSTSTNELSNKISEIPKVIELVGEKVEETRTMVSELAIEARGKSNGEITEVDEDKKDFIEKFLWRSSSAGLLILYSCLLSLQNTIPFKILDLIEETDLLNDNYSRGFLVASWATRIIDYEFKKDILSVSSLNDHLIELLPEFINSEFEKVEKGNESLQKRLIKNKEIIEEFFRE